MTTTTATSVRINELNAYIAEGKILQAMDAFYADNVIMTEPYHTTEGKATASPLHAERDSRMILRRAVLRGTVTICIAWRV